VIIVLVLQNIISDIIIVFNVNIYINFSCVGLQFFYFSWKLPNKYKENFEITQALESSKKKNTSGLNSYFLKSSFQFNIVPLF